ncbi:MAG: hypothetical protein AB1568_01415 [Thermodesulfobacteriota bacterium]
MKDTKDDALALEKAAKYICTLRCGRCPMVVEHFPCPRECDLDTAAWQCWVVFFRRRAAASDTAAASGGGGSGESGSSTAAGR